MQEKYGEGKGKEWMKDKFTGKAFLTFTRSSDADQFVAKYSK